MPTFAVNIRNLSDRALSFFGYELIDESEEFKVYLDKEMSHHIVQKQSPYLYVEDYNDAMAMRSREVIAIHGLS